MMTGMQPSSTATYKWERVGLSPAGSTQKVALAVKRHRWSPRRTAVASSSNCAFGPPPLLVRFFPAPRRRAPRGGVVPFVVVGSRSVCLSGRCAGVASSRHDAPRRLFRTSSVRRGGPSDRRRPRSTILLSACAWREEEGASEHESFRRLARSKRRRYDGASAQTTPPSAPSPLL